MSSEQVRKPKWPTLGEQLKESNVKKSSALEKLIKDNQDFAMLRPEEATDKLRLPPWLRVHFRKTPSRARVQAGRSDRRLSAGPPGSLSLDDPQPGLEDPGRRESLTTRPGGKHGDQRSDLRRQRRFAPRIRHPVQLQQPQPDHLRLDQARRQPADVVLDRRRRDVVAGEPARRHRRCAPGRSDDRLDLGRDRVDGHDRHRADERVVILRTFKSVDQGATWTFDSNVDGGQTAMDKQALWVDHNAELAVQRQHVSDLAQRQPGVCVQACRAGRHVERAAPGERLGDDGYGHRRRHQDEPERRRVRVLARHRQPGPVRREVH